MSKKEKIPSTVGHKIASVIGIILCIILIPMLIFNITLIIKGFVNPDKVPSVFGISPLIVQSGSMEAQIHTGDVVIVKNVDTSTLKAGDIVAFKSGNVVVTHRISEIVTTESGEKAFVTKGDANNVNDSGSVQLTDVKGKVVYHSLKMGKVVEFCTSPFGIMCVLAVAALIYFMPLFAEKKNRKKAEKG